MSPPRGFGTTAAGASTSPQQTGYGQALHGGHLLHGGSLSMKAKRIALEEHMVELRPMEVLQQF